MFFGDTGHPCYDCIAAAEEEHSGEDGQDREERSSNNDDSDDNTHDTVPMTSSASGSRDMDRDNEQSVMEAIGSLFRYYLLNRHHISPARCDCLLMDSEQLKTVRLLVDIGVPHERMTICNKSTHRTADGHLPYHVIRRLVPHAHVKHLSVHDLLLETTIEFSFLFLDYRNGVAVARQDVKVLFERQLLAAHAVVSYTFASRDCSEHQLDDFENWHGVHAVCAGRTATRIASFMYSGLICVVYYISTEVQNVPSRPEGTATKMLRSLKAHTTMRRTFSCP